ncbi:MAG: hypothetical protein ACK449_17410 [Planctomycetota bacterium]
MNSNPPTDRWNASTVPIHQAAFIEIYKREPQWQVIPPEMLDVGALVLP